MKKIDWWKWRRSVRYWWQRRTRGWDDSETWDLGYGVARYALPRLKRFKELTDGYPPNMTEQEWNESLDKMIYSLEQMANEEWTIEPEGLRLFGEFLPGLWW